LLVIWEFARGPFFIEGKKIFFKKKKKRGWFIGKKASFCVRVRQKNNNLCNCGGREGTSAGGGGGGGGQPAAAREKNISPMNRSCPGRGGGKKGPPKKKGGKKRYCFCVRLWGEKKKEKTNTSIQLFSRGGKEGGKRGDRFSPPGREEKKDSAVPEQLQPQRGKTCENAGKEKGLTAVPSEKKREGFKRKERTCSPARFTAIGRTALHFQP